MAKKKEEKGKKDKKKAKKKGEKGGKKKQRLFPTNINFKGNPAPSAGLPFFFGRLSGNYKMMKLMAAVNDLEQIGDVIEVSLVDPGEKRVRKLVLTIKSVFVIRMNIVSV